MKVYKSAYGFDMITSCEIKEINAALVQMEHKKSGARLFFLDREDDNKTFAIAFKTIPTDDTGVFHILEHSVLCGSEKFPVKDPFTELIKGSVSTYLNAMTYPDRTVYPLSTKNDKALLGLTDVYLDAVFNPKAISNPLIFMQEGCRYEVDGETLKLNGVVYNEMKGAYSSAEEYADYLITKLVSPESTYSHDSGGNPDAIPELSYDDFKLAHAKFYHPSNSTIFLDGSVDLDAILKLIDSYLSKYDRIYELPDINNGEKTVTKPLITTYPIEKGEDEKNKTRIYLCHNSFKYAEREKNIALALACEAIADSNNAVLTKRILQSGLCESFSFYPTRSYSVNALNAVFVGVKDEKENELIELYEKELSRILIEGIPKDNLDSALKRLEFNTREADYGSYPKGMVYMSACIEAACLGIDPKDRLAYEDIFTSLREKIDTDHFVSILKEVTSSHRATLILHPDRNFTEKKDKLTSIALKEKYDSLTAEEIERIKENTAKLTAWQEEEDTEDALSTIPKLKISDLNTVPKRTATEVYYNEGCKVISHPLHTGGIAYAELYFDLSDIDICDIPYVRLFSELMSEWPTKDGDASLFRNKVKKHLGMFNLSALPIKQGKEPKLYTVLRISCLDSEKGNAISLMKEHLFSTIFEDANVLKQNVKQLYTASIEYISARGDGVAMIRDAAKHSEYEALNEALFGYSYHSFIKELSDGIDARANEVLKKLETIRERYIKRERLTIGITEPDGFEFAKNLILANR